MTDAREKRNRAYLGAVRLGMVASALFHLVALLFLARTFEITGSAYVPVERPLPRPPQGLRVIQYREVTVEPEPERRTPRERRPRALPTVPRRPVVEGPAPLEGGEAGRLTNAEKLQPREGDPRLWKDFSERALPERRLGFSRADSAVRAIVAAMLDSLSAEERRAAVEWLAGEGDQQWGITPEGIRLGGITIPISLGQLFAEEGPRGREARQQQRDVEQIRQQDMLQDAEAVRRERVQEMRRRSREEVQRREETEAERADTTPALVPD
ncbi:MAG: hypothetical protein ACE5JR_04105 [Gemmatimonadota bacterium]